MEFKIKLPILIRCLAAIFLFGVGACKPSSTNSDSAVKGFIADNESGNNYIAAFLGDSSGIPGTLKDIGNIGRVFNAANGLNFQMPGPDEGGWKHATKEQFKQETAKIAKTMLDKDIESWANLQKGGTLFFYVTSHGAQDGTTSTQSGQLRFAEVATAIRDARSGYPVERLIVMFDTCFSGQNIVGDQSINQTTGSSGLSLQSSADGISQSGMDDYITKIAADANSVKGFYKSAIFIGASRPLETSGDAPMGGVGTMALIESVNAAKNGISNPADSASAVNGLLGNNQNTYAQNQYIQNVGLQLVEGDNLGAGSGNGSSTTTIKQVLDGMVSRAFGQTPTYCVYPKALADDFFFDPPAGYLPANPINAVNASPDDKYCSQ